MTTDPCLDATQKKMSRTVMALAIFFNVLLTGCGGSGSGIDKATPRREENPQSVGAMQVTRPRIAARQTVENSVNQSIKTFQAIEGRYPDSLNQLKTSGYTIPEIPDGYKARYDDKTGKFTLEWQG